MVKVLPYECELSSGWKYINIGPDIRPKGPSLVHCLCQPFLVGCLNNSIHTQIVHGVSQLVGHWLRDFKTLRRGKLGGLLCSSPTPWHRKNVPKWLKWLSNHPIMEPPKPLPHGGRTPCYIGGSRSSTARRHATELHSTTSSRSRRQKWRSDWWRSDKVRTRSYIYIYICIYIYRIYVDIKYRCTDIEYFHCWYRTKLLYVYIYIYIFGYHA